MRTLLLIVADKDIREAFLGLFERPDWNTALGCRRIDISPKDVVEPPGQKDPGLFKRAHELARPYCRTHQHLLVLLDSAWDGSPGTDEIQKRIAEDLERNGWEDTERFEVVAIEPELEVWLWCDEDASNKAFACELAPGARSMLCDTVRELMKRDGEDPKARLASLRQGLKIPASSALCRRFASHVRLDRCDEPAFDRLRTALRRWFPA